ncbi:F-box/kelch-repeat protein [Raphanus sativus]|nr:F-box/kelch-repeat protein [Raphanus sativus]
MAEKENSSSETPSLIQSLPEEVIIDILARVSRWVYPTLSLVSKQFRSLVASPDLYARRSLLGCTEDCLYNIFYERETGLRHWCILLPEANGNRRLVRIPLLPALTHGESFVAVGSKIYMFGGTTMSALSIDCRSHTVEPLPSMPVPMLNTMAGIIDEKIYVMGRFYDYKNGIMVFNTKTQMWEPEVLNGEEQRHDPGLDYLVFDWVVMYDKMYVRDHIECSVYDPKENRWRPEGILSSKDWKNACVIDDILYHGFSVDGNYNLSTYDPKLRCWGLVKGLGKLLSGMCWIHAANYGGKLVLFFAKAIFNGRRNVTSSKEICCAEISLERRQGGEIWGKVEWSGQVLVAVAEKSRIRKSLNVLVISSIGLLLALAGRYVTPRTSLISDFLTNTKAMRSSRNVLTTLCGRWDSRTGENVLIYAN